MVPWNPDLYKLYGGPVKEYTARKATLPAAGEPLLQNSISPFRQVPRLMGYFTPSIAGVLTIIYTLDADERYGTVYDGAELKAGNTYPFEMVPISGETVNLKFSTTGGTFTFVAQE